MKREKLILWGLVLLFAILMSVPFLVPHCGFVALFGLVPLLCMDRMATLSGTRNVWIYHYSAFVLWNTITAFWVCNATIGGGLFAILVNSLQMSVVFALFRLSKRRFNGVLPYLFLVVAWIAWERAYFDTQISWPWLLLGNSFARSVESVQWYEYTGCLGGSLWVWLTNLTIFGFMVMLSDGSWSVRNWKAKTAMVLWTVLIIFCPFAISKSMFNHYQEEENPLDVVIFQPNIDPYSKFFAMTQQQQNDVLIEQVSRKVDDDAARPLLLIAPETFTNDVRINITADGQEIVSPTLDSLVSFLETRPGVNILFGASSFSFFTAPKRPSYTARQLYDGRWMESHNSALIADGSGRVEIFHKSKLVVGVEKTPWPAIFCKVDDWLGGVMGRCVGQDSISLLHCVSSDAVIPLGTAVCYESVYGEYYTGYIREGAEVMTIITNDAWWGNTPGYRQHLSFASLRAIETRRSIARCANTGISCFIDQRGVIHDPSPWWEQTVLEGQINRNNALTFFVLHGDITGRVCTFLFLLLLLALVVNMLIPSRIAKASGTKTESTEN